MDNIKSFIRSLDTRLLMWPLLGLLAVFFGSVVLDMSVSRAVQDSIMQLDESNGNLASLRAQIEDIAAEESMVVRYIDEYLAIEESGAFQPEDRLALFQMLDNLRTGLGLFPISVSIDNQQRVAIPSSYTQEVSSNQVGLSGSRLRLKIPLAHEGLLIDFLNEFQKRHSLSLLESCVLEPSTVTELAATNFSAECVINWVTFDFDNSSPESVNNDYIEATL